MRLYQILYQILKENSKKDLFIYEVCAMLNRLREILFRHGYAVSKANEQARIHRPNEIA